MGERALQPVCVARAGCHYGLRLVPGGCQGCPQARRWWQCWEGGLPLRTSPLPPSTAAAHLKHNPGPALSPPHHQRHCPQPLPAAAACSCPMHRLGGTHPDASPRDACRNGSQTPHPGPPGRATHGSILNPTLSRQHLPQAHILSHHRALDLAPPFPPFFPPPQEPYQLDAALQCAELAICMMRLHMHTEFTGDIISHISQKMSIADEVNFPFIGAYMIWTNVSLLAYTIIIFNTVRLSL